jgi:hypothetical protein
LAGLLAIGILEESPMKKVIIVAAFVATVGASSHAQAIGCISGGAAGAVAGHYAGHHAVLGAVGGCVAGHVAHKRQAADRKQKQQEKKPQDDQSAD